MAHELDCVVDGCDTSITGESEEEVVKKAEEHAEEDHPDLELDEESVETIKENIEEA